MAGRKGFELITQLGANVRGFSAGSNVIPADVGMGQVIYGMAIDFYAYGKIAEIGADKIHYVVPPDAAVVSPDSIAILKGAPNMEVAQKFLDFRPFRSSTKTVGATRHRPRGTEMERAV